MLEFTDVAERVIVNLSSSERQNPDSSSSLSRWARNSELVAIAERGRLKCSSFNRLGTANKEFSNFLFLNAWFCNVFILLYQRRRAMSSSHCTSGLHSSFPSCITAPLLTSKCPLRVQGSRLYSRTLCRFVMVRGQAYLNRWSQQFIPNVLFF